MSWARFGSRARNEPYVLGPAVSLKPDLFEGMRFDFNKGLNQKFSLTHSIFMGSVEVPVSAILCGSPSAVAAPLVGMRESGPACSGASQTRTVANPGPALRPPGAVAGLADNQDSGVVVRVWVHPRRWPATHDRQGLHRRPHDR